MKQRFFDISFYLFVGGLQQWQLIGFPSFAKATCDQLRFGYVKKTFVLRKYCLPQNFNVTASTFFYYKNIAGLIFEWQGKNLRCFWKISHLSRGS